MKTNKAWKARVFRAAAKRVKAGRERMFIASDSERIRCSAIDPKARNWCPLGAIVIEASTRGIPYHLAQPILVETPKHGRDELCMELHRFSLEKQGVGIALLNERTSDVEMNAFLGEFGKHMGYTK